MERYFYCSKTVFLEKKSVLKIKKVSIAVLILIWTKIVSTTVNNDNTTKTITVNGNKMTTVIIMIITTIIMMIAILSSDITLVTKHVNEVNEVLKGVSARNLTELEYVARASALLICEKVGVKIDHTTNKKEPF